MIVGHRGASGDAPENTIAAFELAWKQGADAIEGDFHLAKDGEMVCIHDGNTKRVADRNLTVSQSTLAELKALDVGVYRGGAFKGATIPTIAEVFATVPAGKKIYIEVKCGPELIPALLDAIEASGLKDEQVVVISFRQAVIRTLKAEAPQYKAYWLTELKKDESGEIVPTLGTVLATLEAIKADGVSSSANIKDADFVSSVRERGYEYHVWTVDDLEAAKRFVSWGVDSITTNRPGCLVKHLHGVF